MNSNNSRSRIFSPIRTLIFALMLLLILVSAQQGFASSEVSEMPMRGEGVGNISGYHITNIHYHPNPSNPTEVVGVTLEAYDSQGDSSANWVTISLDQGRSWTSCFRASGESWTCSLDLAVSIQMMEEIQVSAGM